MALNAAGKPKPNTIRPWKCVPMGPPTVNDSCCVESQKKGQRYICVVVDIAMATDALKNSTNALRLIIT